MTNQKASFIELPRQGKRAGEVVCRIIRQSLAELEAIKQELITLKQLPERQQYETRKSEFDLRLQILSDRHQNCKHQRHEKHQIFGETL